MELHHRILLACSFVVLMFENRTKMYTNLFTIFAQTLTVLHSAWQRREEEQKTKKQKNKTKLGKNEQVTVSK